MNPFEVLWEYRQAFSSGLLVTTNLVVLAAVLGSAIGFVLTLVARFSFAVIRVAIESVSFCAAAIPALVILFWVHYPAQSMLGVVIDPFWSALVVLVTLNSFAIYRIATDALTDYPQQFSTAALVCGLSKVQTLRYIQAPLLLRQILPRWIDQQIAILHTSLFASLISVEETFRIAQRINSEVYQPVLIYSAMALLFLCIGGSAMLVAQTLKRRYGRDFSER